MASGQFELLLTDRSGQTQDATQLVRSLTWSGSESSVTRSVSFSVLQNEADTHLPAVAVDLSCGVELLIDGVSVFSGLIVERSRDSAAYEIDCTAYDWGYYLRQNETYLRVDKQTAEAVTGQICSELSIQTGALAATGVSLSHNFLPSDYYTIIRTLYDLAAATTGDEYAIRFVGNAVNVVKIAKTDDTIMLRPSANLINCTSKESVAGLKNRVKIFDDNDVVDSTVDDSASQQLYGVFQAAILKSSYDDASAEAQQIIKEHEVSTTLSLQCLGDARLISGNTVVVNEPITGANGLMRITSDAHTWTRGVYRTKITAVFDELVDEQTAAEADEAAATPPQAATTKTTTKIPGGRGTWVMETR